MYFSSIHIYIYTVSTWVYSVIHSIKRWSKIRRQKKARKKRRCTTNKTDGRTKTTDGSTNNGQRRDKNMRNKTTDKSSNMDKGEIRLRRRWETKQSQNLSHLGRKKPQKNSQLNAIKASLYQNQSANPQIAECYFLCSFQRHPFICINTGNMEIHIQIVNRFWRVTKLSRDMKHVCRTRYTCIHFHMHTRTNYMHTEAHTHTHAHMYIYTHTLSHTYMHANTHTHTLMNPLITDIQHPVKAVG